MIYDRTLSDVHRAKRIRTDFVQKGQSLSEEQISQLERGFITVNTLNRIENKQSELKKRFEELGYWGVDIQNRQWDVSDIFDEINFKRLLNNLNVLKEAFWVYSNTPATPVASYNYYVINDLEHILYDFEQMIEDIKSYWRECGTFECGKE